MTGSGGTEPFSLKLRNVDELMPSSCHRTPLLLKEVFAALKKSIQDPSTDVNEFLQNPRDPDGKLRYLFDRYLRGKLKKWVDELQGIQLELDDELDWDLAETENERERPEKMEGIKELMFSHHEYLQGLKFH